MRNQRERAMRRITRAWKEQYISWNYKLALARADVTEEDENNRRYLPYSEYSKLEYLTRKGAVRSLLNDGVPVWMYMKGDER